MTRPVAVLRPEPGNAATAARVATLGLVPIRLPLFDVRAIAWAVPDPTRFDALLLTSANAVRHAGPGLARLAALSVLAVGAATARVAREAGLAVRLTGDADASALLAEAQAIGIGRALHLAGRERMTTSSTVAEVTTIYASDLATLVPEKIRSLTGSVALLHSPRAAARLATLVDEAAIDRASIRLAALSEVVARAAGIGWNAIAVAAAPNDAKLLDQARLMCG